MHDPIETIERAGYRAEIHYDIDPQSPEDWDTLGTLAYDYRHASINRDDLPSDHYGIGRFRDDCTLCDGTGDLEDVANGIPVGTCPKCNGEGCALDGPGLALRLRDAAHVLPVYAYDDRMGTVLTVADDWEQANGWIHCTREHAETYMGKDASDETILAALESELATWNQYLQGDVYGIIVTDPNGQEVDACWGFYGITDTIEEAKGMLDIEAVRLLEARPGLADLKVN